MNIKTKERIKTVQKSRSDEQKKNKEDEI